jgi:hypothetical protein
MLGHFGSLGAFCRHIDVAGDSKRLFKKRVTLDHSDLTLSAEHTLSLNPLVNTTLTRYSPKFVRSS